MTLPECAEEIARGETDFLLAGAGPRDKRPGSGRGTLARFRLAGRGVVGKRALHGGLLGRFLGGLYLGRKRGLRQLQLAHRLDRAGLPTPEILAFGWRRSLGVLHAQAIIAREIPRAQNLYEAARENAPWRRRRVILESSGSLVRRMHDAGFVHGDLNVTNLVVGEGPEGDRLHIVDLDRGRFVRRVGSRQRFRNLARLLRSYEKWIAGRWRLTPREEMIFLRGYCGPDRSLLRDLGHRLQSYRRRLGLRRIAWGWSVSAASDEGTPARPQ
ncbi:MAG TPA: lipopolysaccharide kinase InaA family protein [Candidatus Polarisedimenticolia bacterium]|nr:lipopolysaccharide kinase InaA family protein [Candidatus Polarisedimenticolia bacterium]